MSNATVDATPEKNVPDINTYGLTDLGYKIFLDRYALKDLERKIALKEGDIVIVVLNNDKDMSGKREIAVIKEFLDDNQISVITKTGDLITTKLSNIDMPLEISPSEMHERIARGIASVENKEIEPEMVEQFKWLLDNWKFVPGGRILTAAGTDQKLSLFNCFVINSPQDSRGGIFTALSEMAEIMARGGGVGINVSTLRPRNAYVKGVNGRSSGAASWADLYSVVTGKIEQGGCVTADTRIQTNQGLLKIIEIVERIESGDTSLMAWTHRGWKAITDKFRNGIKDVYRVTTDLGYEVEITGEHGLTVFNPETGDFEETKVNNLESGQYLSILIGETENTNHTYQLLITNYSDVKQRKQVNLPSILDEKLAYILGFYMGNGHIMRRPINNGGSDRLVLAVPHDRPETQQMLIENVKDVFGIDVSIYDGDGAVNNIAINSLSIVEFFEDNGFKKLGSPNAFVPDQIFSSPNEVIQAFIGGWFAADGSNKGRKAGLQIASVSRVGIKGIQQLLIHLGIPSNIYLYERPEENWRNIYYLSINGAWASHRAAAWMGKYSSKVADKPLPIKNHAFSYPHSFLERYKRQVGSKIHRRVPSGNSNTSQHALQLIRETDITDDNLIDHSEMISNCIVTKIVSIEPLGKMETFDLTVDEIHKLSFNGIYGLNSRRGALMLILNDWHPDVLEFIKSKRQAGKITNANISIGISDDFMEAVKNDTNWYLVFPDTKHEKYDDEWDGILEKWVEKGYPVITYETLKARDIWNTLIESAWASAEPGMWFRDRTNKMSNSRYYDEGYLIATNPCGELPLAANGVCNLGAINLSNFTNQAFGDTSNINWDMLGDAVKVATRFLDNVVDYTYYVSDANYKQQQGERRLGLGVMGLADLMIRCGIRYGSDESVEFVENLFHFIARNAYLTSIELAKEKGSFPWFDKDKHLNSGYMQHMDQDIRDAIYISGVRNVVILTIAPTGSTGTMVNASTGIEPYFSWKWYRQGRLGIHEENAPIVAEYIEHSGSETLPEFFVTAMDLLPEEHVKVMAAAQTWIDSAISKTTNCPNEYTIEQTANLYMYMYDLGCKGGTIYRDGSRNEQVLHLENPEEKKESKSKGGIVDVPAMAIVGEPGPEIFVPSPVTANYETAQEFSVRNKRRPALLNGVTFQVATPYSTNAYVTVNEDENRYPYEVFITVGKAGSDLQAQAESIGRLISKSLQIMPPYLRFDGLREIVLQLVGIGGNRSSGFGPNQVRSLPDAIGSSIMKMYVDKRDIVAQAEEQIKTMPTPTTTMTITTSNDTYTGSTIATNVFANVTANVAIPTNGNGNGHNHDGKNAYNDNTRPAIKSMSNTSAMTEMCPDCQNYSLIREEGCKHCHNCGYSEC